MDDLPPTQRQGRLLDDRLHERIQRGGSLGSTSDEQGVQAGIEIQPFATTELVHGGQSGSSEREPDLLGCSERAVRAQRHRGTDRACMTSDPAVGPPWERIEIQQDDRESIPDGGTNDGHADVPPHGQYDTRTDLLDEIA